MKKLLISIFALGYILNLTAGENISSELQGLGEKPHYKSAKDYLEHLSPKQKTRAGETESNLYGYCFDIEITKNNAFGLGPNYIGSVMEGVMEIPGEVAKQWKGSKVTGVNIGFGQSPMKQVMVYITKDLEGEPELMQEGTIEQQFAWNLISLDNPYEIDGDGFFIGYQSPLTSTDAYPLTVDFNPYATTYGDIVGVMSKNNVTGEAETTYEHLIGMGYGSVCLQAEIDGATVPDLGVLLTDLFVPSLCPINVPFDSFFSLENIGLKTLTGVELECKVNGVVQENVEVTLYGDLYTDGVKDVPFGRPGYVFLSGLKSNAAGNIPVEVTVKKLIAEDGSSQAVEQVIETKVFVAGTTYEKTVVVEEFTGTWCGNCPRGIVGMKYMEENYGDKGFIGIAVHYNDKMEVNSYWDIIEYYSQGQFPSAVMDRNYYFDPSKETLEAYYKDARQLPTEAKVEISAQYDEEKNSVTAVATSEYGFTADEVTYALAFVVTENNVGPYVQENYFAGSSVDMDGWQNLGPSVLTTFDHVARNIWFAFGIKDSQPANVEEKTPYTFSIDLPMDNVKNVNDCDVIVMLINYTTGMIVNGAKMSLEGQAGVESLIGENEAAIYKAYNLNGVKVMETKDAGEINNLPKGIYIVNGKKVVVK